MKHFFLLLLSASGLSLTAQRPAPDTLRFAGEQLIVQPVLHSALVLKYQGKTIYVDPYGGAKSYEGLPAPDLVLITDIHGDHTDTSTLNHLDLSKSKLVIPPAVRPLLSTDLQQRCIMMENNNQQKVLVFNIEALPMYNLPEEANSRHPKGRGNGYIITMGKIRVYISGDTEDIPEMRALRNIDLAFVCMNLPYTMSVEQAAEAVLAFKPVHVYPFHYRGKPEMGDIDKFQRLVNGKNSAILVHLKDWYSLSK